MYIYVLFFELNNHVMVQSTFSCVMLVTRNIKIDIIKLHDLKLMEHYYLMLLFFKKNQT